MAGNEAPEFSLLDPVSGKQIALCALRGKNVLLVFFRGTWCPFCREQMRVLTENYPRLQKANITILGVVCQDRKSVEKYAREINLPFPLLPDESREIAKKYGTHYAFSWEGFNLSHPALFIIDGEGCVQFAHIGRNMKDLPVSHILGKFVSFLGAE